MPFRRNMSIGKYGNFGAIVGGIWGFSSFPSLAAKAAYSGRPPAREDNRPVVKYGQFPGIGLPPAPLRPGPPNPTIAAKS